MSCIFKTVCLVVVLTVVSCESAVGQIFIPPAPPDTTTPPDPCIILQINVNTANAGLNSWNAILVQRQNDLARAQARLALVRSWSDLFWTLYNQQTRPMSDGQIMAIGMINSAIRESELYVAQLQGLVQQAQGQVHAWSVQLQNAQAAFNAAGC